MPNAFLMINQLKRVSLFLTLLVTLGSALPTVGVLASTNVSTSPQVTALVTSISASSHTMMVQWNNIPRTIVFTSRTHTGSLSGHTVLVSQFSVGDTVLLTLYTSGAQPNEAAIVTKTVTEQQERPLIQNASGYWVTLNSISKKSNGSGSLSVTLQDNEWMNGNNLNEEVGRVGEKKTVTFTSNTKFVRKYMATAALSEFQTGDHLFVVGTVSHDGTITATIVKDDNIWLKGVEQHAGKLVGDAIYTDGTGWLDIQPTSVVGQAAIIQVAYTKNTTFTLNGQRTSANQVRVGDTINVNGIARLNDDGTVTLYNVTQVFIKR